MPNFLKTVADKTNLSKKDVEDLWKKAKKRGKGKSYPYIVGIFKKSLGEKRLKDIGWLKANNCIEYIKIISSKQIMFHGTSSKNLRSILKKGLIYNLNKVWNKNKDRLFESFEGIYLTKDLESAITASREAVSSFGGNPLLVAAQIETRTPSVLIDEDLIGFKYSFDLIITEDFRLDINRKDPFYKNSWKYFKIRIEKTLETSFSIGFKYSNFKNIFKKYIDSIVILKIYKDFELGTLEQNYELKKPFSVFKEKARTVYNINNQVEAIDFYRECLDNFLNKVKFIAENRIEHNSIRIKESINYKGKNRILVIATVENKKILKFHYSLNEKYENLLYAKFLESRGFF